MIHSNNIRRRLVLAAFTLATIVAAIFAGGFYFAFDMAEDRLFDDHILADVDAYMLAYERDPGFAEIKPANCGVFIADGSSTATLPAYLHDVPLKEDEVWIDGREFELQRRTLGSKTFYFLFDESEFEEFEHAILVTMCIIAILTIGGAAWAGHIIADRIIQPLTSLSQRVDAMGSGDGPDIRLEDYAGSEDEIAHLATAIQGYHSRISELLRREHEFSADVSHELRTPIMAIQGAAELLEQQVTDANVQNLITRIRRGCFHMTTLTEALLYLARDPESFKDMVEPVSVKGIVDAQIAAVRDVVGRKGITVHVEESADTIINAIPAVIDIVIGNILKNAVKYTDKNVINILVANEKVVIQDYGPGIDETVQTTLFDRFKRGQNRNSDGNGIGLALVRRFCEQYGWAIDFQSDLESGTRVAVIF